MINSNDPNQPHVRCQLSARTRTLFEVSPRFVEWNASIHADKSTVKTILQLKRSTGASSPMQWKALGDWFTCRQMPRDQLEVSLAEGTPFGDHHGIIELFLDESPHEIVRVPVYARIVTPLSVAPSSLVLRKSSESAYHPLTLVVYSSNKDVRLGDLSIECEGLQAHIESTAVIDPYRKRCRVVVDEVLANNLQSSLVLMDRSSGEFCTLPVRLLAN